MDSETLHAQPIDLLATFDDLAQQAAEKARSDDLPVMQRAYFTGCVYSFEDARDRLAAIVAGNMAMAGKDARS